MGAKAPCKLKLEAGCFEAASKCNIVKVKIAWGTVEISLDQMTIRWPAEGGNSNEATPVVTGSWRIASRSVGLVRVVVWVRVGSFVFVFRRAFSRLTSNKPCYHKFCNGSRFSRPSE